MSKQADLEAWLATGKPITFILGWKMWKLIDLRKAISRIHKHVHVERKYVRRGNTRYAVYWIPLRKVPHIKRAA